ncbi:ABC transporter ATP-binding protein [Microvirga puerhi]|uniref:ABC transporter ATP-binding protein n=1 Tax=Microvirga puerhi TaxID=2876078 RepID=A0ABS7VJQ7_9HYPH|nr:ABC transporter ATP-binding protein [Microvirga puerhi]MBZ6075755.1 ABC transporter ATP-binding protein [Microvirga puerhi]
MMILAQSSPLRPISANGPVLELKNLGVAYGRGAASVQVVHDVSLAVERGEALGIVGESGCGKSQTMLAALGLLPRGGRITSGQVLLEGQDLVGRSPRQMRPVRGREIALISQDALTSLNPAMTIGKQMAEPMIHYGGMSRSAARQRCTELLDLVGIPGAAARLASYPHELSGGMRQRALIAMAISANPKVLIADEPTTALDVTTQSQILRLIDSLRKELGMALILITHDLGVVAGVADRVAVLYAGRVVETAETETLFAAPRHPYTKALLDSIARIEDDVAERLNPIPGLPPDPRNPVSGCAFHPRCEYSREICRNALPILEDGTGAQHPVRCHVDPFVSSSLRAVGGAR